MKKLKKIILKIYNTMPLIFSINSLDIRKNKIFFIAFLFSGIFFWVLTKYLVVLIEKHQITSLFNVEIFFILYILKILCLIYFLFLFYIYLNLKKNYIVFMINTKEFSSTFYFILNFFLILKSFYILKNFFFILSLYHYAVTIKFPISVIFLLISFMLSLFTLMNLDLQDHIIYKIRNSKNLNYKKTIKKIFYVSMFLLFFFLLFYLLIFFNLDLEIRMIVFTLFSGLSIPVIYCSGLEDNSSLSLVRRSSSNLSITNTSSLQAQNSSTVHNTTAAPSDMANLSLVQPSSVQLNLFEHVSSYLDLIYNTSALNDNKSSLILASYAYHNGLPSTPTYPTEFYHLKQEAEEQCEEAFRSLEYFYMRKLPVSHPFFNELSVLKGIIFSAGGVQNITNTVLFSLSNLQRSILILETLYETTAIPEAIRLVVSKLLVFPEDEAMFQNEFLFTNLNNNNFLRSAYIYSPSANFDYPFNHPFYIIRMTEIYDHDSKLYLQNKDRLILASQTSEDQSIKTVLLYLKELERYKNMDKVNQALFNFTNS